MWLGLPIRRLTSFTAQKKESPNAKHGKWTLYILLYTRLNDGYLPITTDNPLFKNKLADVEISVIIVILILIDEVHHFLISSLTLLSMFGVRKCTSSKVSELMRK